MGAGLIFVWNATRGNRLRPWRSECLKWRVETYTGKHAEEVGLRDFLSVSVCRTKTVAAVYAMADGDEGLRTRGRESVRAGRNSLRPAG